MENIPFPTVPYPRMEPPAHREKKMKVLALGMSRTGTMSLYVALKELGYTCYHMAECNLDQQNDSLRLWNRAIDAKFNGNGHKFAGADFDQMLWRYDAITDIPCILFVEELMDAYPDARIVLTTRPVEPWLASMQRTFYAILGWKRWSLLEFIDPTYIGLYIPLLRSALSVWTGGTWQDSSRLQHGFAAHYDLVRTAAQKRGREVLEFKVQDGWEPLCQFLRKEKEKPNHPSPHVNEGDFITKFHYIIFWMRLVGVLKPWLTWIVFPVAAVTASWWWYRS
ncbi:putative NAD dependent epimerase/dehydratase [Aspergillus nomiae NRRL 13137]|uniref:Putative NAD dependent epimerase/dehydratase n=1 Tax=Aspergillus nomiae NRRL (strain ATCC 15546 / NRRL 13137 / CBS 260.88 / M93) TaxID=1509407 RepID=A0A0L1JBC0_ASPN3|nr:putative NAD dependent epimerase/dehydratase [Aspergillus nomiae NRRL 13137]KNG89007.1 putative NAD dependent epimerase/dehydratase [Aspergillus nomiae NRRL 13137]